VVRADDKKAARLAIIRDLITRVEYHDPKPRAPREPAILARFDETCLTSGLLAT
jgi:hypothetical protein